MSKRGGAVWKQVSKPGGGPHSTPPLSAHGANPLSDASSSCESGTAKSGFQKKEKSEIDAVRKEMSKMLTSDHLRGSSVTPSSVGNVPQRVTPRSGHNVHKASGQKPKQFESPSFKDMSRDDKLSSPSTLSDSDTKYIYSIRSVHGAEEMHISSPSTLSDPDTKYIYNIQSVHGVGDMHSSSHSISTPTVNTQVTKEEPSLTVPCGLQNSQFLQTGITTPESSKGEHGKSDDQCKGSFDICTKSSGQVVKLKTSLLNKNRERRNEMKRQVRGENIMILKPGMVLLKGYLSLTDQVKLVKLCRDLGLGSGGFYQPGYRDGAKLQLKMMCLGKNWDPETNLYGDERPVDGSKPPPIPLDFMQMVTGAIQECHGYLESHSKVKNPKDVVPSMSPDICIVNFYSKTGKLGLHQDKDESAESLRRGLPVVSFSVGDSAEFLYGLERDIFKADKVKLESGDVLIFGGTSRHIFHGVSSIFPDTAPKALGDETNLKPGRLNLTFREY